MFCHALGVSRQAIKTLVFAYYTIAPLGCVLFKIGRIEAASDFQKLKGFVMVQWESRGLARTSSPPPLIPNNAPRLLVRHEPDAPALIRSLCV